MTCHGKDNAAKWRCPSLTSPLLIGTVLLLFACALEPQHAWPGVAFKHEYDDICSKTEDSEGLSVEELKSLISRCDRLRSVIEKADEPERTIYLKKLRKCRDLFVYVMETKTETGSGGP